MPNATSVVKRSCARKSRYVNLRIESERPASLIEISKEGPDVTDLNSSGIECTHIKRRRVALQECTNFRPSLKDRLSSSAPVRNYAGINHELETQAKAKKKMNSKH